MISELKTTLLQKRNNLFYITEKASQHLLTKHTRDILFRKWKRRLLWFHVRVSIYTWKISI